MKLEMRPSVWILLYISSWCIKKSSSSSFQNKNAIKSSHYTEWTLQIHLPVPSDENNDLRTINIACYDDQIFKSITNEITTNRDAVRVAFYLFKNEKCYFLGYKSTSIKTLKKELKQFEYNFYNGLNNEANWDNVKLINVIDSNKCSLFDYYNGKHCKFATKDIEEHEKGNLNNEVLATTTDKKKSDVDVLAVLYKYIIENDQQVSPVHEEFESIHVKEDSAKDKHEKKISQTKDKKEKRCKNHQVSRITYLNIEDDAFQVLNPDKEDRHPDLQIFASDDDTDYVKPARKKMKKYYYKVDK